MNENTIARHPVVLPIIASLLCLAMLTMAGLTGPVFAEMIQDFELDPLSTRLKIATSLRWYWTMPIGALMAFILMRGSRVWSRHTNMIVDIAVICIVSIQISKYEYKH